MRSSQYKQLVWDYHLTPTQFKNILNGKKTIGSMNQVWAITRVLENLNYYDAMSLVPLDTLKNNWNKIKNRLFNQSIKDGYQFVLQQHSLSASR